MGFGWGGFVARTAVRKIVYVLVGLALAGILAATGVKAAGADLARDGTATGSSTYSGGYIAAYAIDGDMSTAWASAGAAGSYLTVDLGAAASVGSARTLTYGCASDLGWSEDGSSFTTVAELGTSSESTVDSGEVEFTPVTARYWRLTATACAGAAVDNVYRLSLFEAAAEGGLACDPSCTVTLADDDRTIVVFGFGLVSFLLAAIAVTNGLRRS